MLLAPTLTRGDTMGVSRVSARVAQRRKTCNGVGFPASESLQASLRSANMTMCVTSD